MKSILRVVTFAAGAVVAAATIALLTPGLASANNGRVGDRRDARTPLDIASVSHGHAGTRLAHTLRTYKPFSSKLLKGNSAIVFGFDVNSDSSAERLVVVVWAQGALRGVLLDEDGNFVGRVPVSRPDSRSVKVTLPQSAIDNAPIYGWAGATLFQSKKTCRKGCLDAAPNRGFLRHRLYYIQSLHVHVNGDGNVMSDPDGIDCAGPDDCSAEFKRGTTVTLTATPVEDQTFTGWSGACTGTSTTCSVKLSRDASVTATFEPTYQLTVTTTNLGTVRLVPPDILCSVGSPCMQRYDQGTTVTLTAQPGPDKFVGWSGACSGTNPVCTLTMDGDKTVSANFSP